MNRRYELIAARIEQTLAAHRINGRVWEARILPAYMRFALTVPVGQRVDDVLRLDDEIAMALGVRGVRIERSNGQLCIDVPRDHTTVVPLASLHKGQRRGCASLGIDTEGRSLLLSLDSPDVPHVLISGMTGSGKTELLRSMVTSAIAANSAGLLQVLVCDVAGNLSGVCDPHHLWLGKAPAVTPETCTAALAHAALQIDRRTTGALPRLLIAIDELADLMVQAPEVAEPLLRLTQRGRQAAINVYAATQRPAAVLVGGMIKANFPARIVGSVASPEDAKVASGIAGTRAERLIGRGDFVLVARGEQIRFQAALADHGPKLDTSGLGEWRATSPAGATAAKEPSPTADKDSYQPDTPDALVVADDAAVLATLRNGRWRIPATTPAQVSAVRRAYERAGRSIAGAVRLIGWSYDDWSAGQVKSALEGGAH